MTDLALPSLNEPVVVQANRVLQGTWARYFRNQLNFLGYSKDVPIYQTLSISLNRSYGASGSTTNRRNLLLPNSYVEGTPLELFIYWLTTDTNTGNVKWDITHRNASNGNALSASSTTTVLSAGPGVNEAVVEERVATIPGAGLIRGSVVRLTLVRDGAHANDTYTGSATMLSVGVKMRAVGIGTVKAYP